MMVNRTIYGTLFVEYLNEQRGTGTKELWRCFSVSLRLMYIQHVQMCARDNTVQRSLSELSLLQSLAELPQKTHRSAGALPFPFHLCAWGQAWRHKYCSENLVGITLLDLWKNMSLPGCSHGGMRRIVPWEVFWECRGERWPVRRGCRLWEWDSLPLKPAHAGSSQQWARFQCQG